MEAERGSGKVGLKRDIVFCLGLGLERPLGRAGGVWGAVLEGRVDGRSSSLGRTMMVFSMSRSVLRLRPRNLLPQSSPPRGPHTCPQQPVWPQLPIRELEQGPQPARGPLWPRPPLVKLSHCRGCCAALGWTLC